MEDARACVWVRAYARACVHACVCVCVCVRAREYACVRASVPAFVCESGITNVSGSECTEVIGGSKICTRNRPRPYVYFKKFEKVTKMLNSLLRYGYKINGEDERVTIAKVKRADTMKQGD